MLIQIALFVLAIGVALIVIGNKLNNKKLKNIGIAIIMLLFLVSILIVTWIFDEMDKDLERHNLTYRENQVIQNTENNEAAQDTASEKPVQGYIGGIITKIENNTISVMTENKGIKEVRIPENSTIINGRTGETMQVEQISVSDYLHLFEYRIEEDKVIPVNPVSVARNIAGNELKQELLKNVQTTSTEIIGNTFNQEKLDIISDKEAIITLTFRDMYYEQFKNESEIFEITIKINSSTKISGVGGAATSVHDLNYGFNNMIFITLDENTMDNKYPVALEYNIYDG